MSLEKQVDHGGHREHGDKAILSDCVNINANGRLALGLFSVSSVLSVFSVVNEVFN